jgi:hypothetical protein
MLVEQLVPEELCRGEVLLTESGRLRRDEGTAFDVEKLCP